MFRWSSPYADVIPTSIDGIRARTMMGGVQHAALFRAALPGVVRARGTTGGGFAARVPAGGLVRALGRVQAGGLVRFRVPGTVRARAQVLGDLADLAAGLPLVLAPEHPAVDPAALLTLTIDLGALEAEAPAADPAASLVPPGVAHALRRVRDRTPALRAVTRPEGSLMIYRKQGDSAGTVTLELVSSIDNVATAAPELALATLVQLRRRSPSGAVTRVAATVADAARGLVTAPLGALALGEAGVHALTVEITTPAGLTTYPAQGSIDLAVEPRDPNL